MSSLPAEERETWLSSLSPDEREDLDTDWRFWGRPAQLLPPGNWRYWLIQSGRGFGKTRTGAETTRLWARTFPLVNMIGATADDARDIMVEGESGLLAICPDRERPTYVPSKRRLEWPNGATTLIFTADEPERLRGKQHMKLWADELAAWRYPDAWDQAMLGLRLGKNPQAIVTTTPKPVRLIRELLANPHTVVSRGRTYDNADNLAPAYLSEIITKYKGTRLGRQELDAELLEDIPGALWQRAQLDGDRVKDAPALRRILVAIDPSVTSGEESDETGIVVVGRDYADRGYVLADYSMRGTPSEWARKACWAVKEWNADGIVAETNNGGDLVETVIRTVDQFVPYHKVHASRGKRTRAEPIAALYEQHRVKHVGTHADLEDQQCLFTADSAGETPDDRVDALVWGLSEVMSDLLQGSLSNLPTEIKIKDAATEPAPNSHAKERATLGKKQRRTERWAAARAAGVIA